MKLRSDLREVTEGRARAQQERPVHFMYSLQFGAEQENVEQNRRVPHRRAEVRDGPTRGVRVTPAARGCGQSAADDGWFWLYAEASVGPVGLDGLHQHRLHDLDQ